MKSKYVIRIRQNMSKQDPMILWQGDSFLEAMYHFWKLGKKHPTLHLRQGTRRGK